MEGGGKPFLQERFPSPSIHSPTRSSKTCRSCPALLWRFRGKRDLRRANRPEAGPGPWTQDRAGPERNAPRHGSRNGAIRCCHRNCRPCRINDVGIEDGIKLVPKAAVLGEDLGKGFGNAPADVAGFLVHVPHQTPDDVAGFLNMFVGHAGNGFPERRGRAIGRLAAEGQTGKQGAHQLTGGDFVQLFGKIVPSRALAAGCGSSSLRYGNVAAWKTPHRFCGVCPQKAGAATRAVPDSRRVFSYRCCNSSLEGINRSSHSARSSQVSVSCSV